MADYKKEKSGLKDNGDYVFTIRTCDMHTAGEPLRIVESGYPELEGKTILEKINYARSYVDKYRQLLINEPRGHDGMYGAIVLKPVNKEAQVSVIFLNNEGYSSMCGHGVIALGRYLIDKGWISPVYPETKIAIECPCGIVDTYVEYDKKNSGHVRFHSVPAYVYMLDAEVKSKKFGNIKVDISYGGAFYAILSASKLGMDLQTTPLSSLADAASEITDAVKAQITLHHPESQDLAFLYGTILTDDNDNVIDSPTANICFFADNQIDRSPTGSGVTARIALQYKKGFVHLDQSRVFESLIKTTFTGKAVEEVIYFNYEAVIVEVSGMSYYTGEHTFRLEKNDPLSNGFQLKKKR